MIAASKFRNNPSLLRHWSHCKVVAFSDAKHGWAVGFAGAILSTSDGGAQWTVQRSRTEPQLRAIALTDARHAWAVGGTIFSTTDGGAHWTTATTITDDTGTLE